MSETPKYYRVVIHADASVKQDKTGIGYYFKGILDSSHENHEDEKILTEGIEVPLNMKTFEGEYAALLYALRKVKEYSTSRITLLCDNGTVVQSILKDNPSAAHRPYVALVKKYLKEYPDWRVKTIPRESNGIAHKKSREACPGVG